MLKRIAVIVLVVIIFTAMLVFTYHNKGTVDVDLILTTVTTSVPVAFTIAFAIGWLFGILCMGAWALRLMNDRRNLRRSLRVSESEVTSLRNLPLNDAD
jgi:lipopolysaccharide assembly protein A